MQTLLLCGTFLVIGFVAGVICICKYIDWRQGKDRKYMEKLNRDKNMLDQWLILKEEGIDLYSALGQKDIKRIAVYGMGIFGRHLIRELRKIDLDLLYAIDRKIMSPFIGVNVFRPEENPPQVDLIINTVIIEHQNITEALKNYFKCPIVNLEDIIFESYPVDR